MSRMVEAIRVPGTFWTPPRKVILPLLIGMGVFLAVVFVGLETYEGWVSTIAFIAGSEIAIGLLGAIFFASIEAHDLEVTSFGVTFRHFWKRVVLPWNALKPTFAPGVEDRLPVEFQLPGSKWKWTVFLTRRQAHALLSHPGAPQWKVPAELLRYWEIGPATLKGS